MPHDWRKPQASFKKAMIWLEEAQLLAVLGAVGDPAPNESPDLTVARKELAISLSRLRDVRKKRKLIPAQGGGS